MIRCPACGSWAVILYNSDGPHGITAMMECQDCGCTGTEFHGKDMAEAQAKAKAEWEATG